MSFEAESGYRPLSDESLEQLAVQYWELIEESTADTVKLYGHPWDAEVDEFLAEKQYPELLTRVINKFGLSNQSVDQLQPVVYGAMASAIDISWSLVRPEIWAMDLSPITRITDARHMRDYIATYGMNYLQNCPTLKSLLISSIGRLEADPSFIMTAHRIGSLTLAQVDDHRQSMQELLGSANGLADMPLSELTVESFGID